MQVVVLAGGQATRMRPLADEMPKSLFPVAGRPFLDHQLERLATSGATSVLLCLGHRAAEIIAHIEGRPLPLPVTYVVEGGELLGTAGAVCFALAQGALAEQFLVTYGDAYLPIDLRPLWLRHLATRAMATMAVFRLNRPHAERTHVPNCQVEGQHVVRYEKFPPSSRPAEVQFIDYGVTALAREQVMTWSADRPLDLVGPLGALAASGHLWAYEVRTRFFEIGSPSGLLELERHLGAAA